MRLLEHMGSHLSLSKAMLTVFTTNTSALSFYSKLGSPPLSPSPYRVNSPGTLPTQNHPNPVPSAPNVPSRQTIKSSLNVSPPQQRPLKFEQSPHLFSTSLSLRAFPNRLEP